MEKFDCVTGCHMTSCNQGLSNDLGREAEKRDPGNEVALIKYYMAA